MTLEEAELIEERFAKAQQRLMDGFRDKLKRVCDDVMGSLYTDVAPYAVTDAHTNYMNLFREMFRESLIRDVAENHSYYSYGHSIRMELMKKYPHIISNKIIEDLQDHIKSLQEHIEQLRSYR